MYYLGNIKRKESKSPLDACFISKDRTKFRKHLYDKAVEIYGESYYIGDLVVEEDFDTSDSFYAHSILVFKKDTSKQVELVFEIYQVEEI